jgi:hypothetical protein
VPSTTATSKVNVNELKTLRSQRTLSPKCSHEYIASLNDFAKNSLSVDETVDSYGLDHNSNKSSKYYKYHKCHRHHHHRHHHHNHHRHRHNHNHNHDPNHNHNKTNQQLSLITLEDKNNNSSRSCSAGATNCCGCCGSSNVICRGGDTNDISFDIKNNNESNAAVLLMKKKSFKSNRTGFTDDPIRSSSVDAELASTILINSKSKLVNVVAF